MDSQLATPNLMLAYQTKDTDLIDRILAACYDAIKTDQHNTLIPATRVIDDPQMRFVEINFGGVSSGVLMLRDNEIHTLFTPPLRGRNAINGMKCGLAWLWRNTPFTEIISHAYSHRPDAIRFAKMCGYKATKTFDDGTTVDGVPVMRTDFICQKP